MTDIEMAKLGITCPECKTDMRVTSTLKKLGAVGRYRLCRKCACRVYTEEIILRTTKEGESDG